MTWYARWRSVVFRAFALVAIALFIPGLAGCVAPPEVSAFEAAGCLPYPSDDPYDVLVHVEDPWMDRMRHWGPDTGSGLTVAGLRAKEPSDPGRPEVDWRRIAPENRPPILIDLLCLALWNEANGRGPADAGLHKDSQDGPEVGAVLKDEFARQHGQAERRCCWSFVHDGRIWSYSTAMISPWHHTYDEWRAAYEEQRRSWFEENED